MVIRGATKQILDEAERSLHDALCVLTQTVKETKIVYGGGTCHLSVSFSQSVVVVEFFSVGVWGK